MTSEANAVLPHPLPSSVFRLTLIVGATVTWLAGCGVRFAYNQLDWLISVYVDDYVTLTSDQRALLQRRVAERLDWHRDTQLPQYACELRQLRAALEDGLDGDAVTRADRALFRYWSGLARTLAPDAAELLRSASEEQIDELFRNLERKNREFRERFVDRPVDELRRDRLRAMERHVRRWIGRLTPAQEQAIERWSSRIVPLGADRLAQHERWQRELRLALASRGDATRFVAAIERLLVRPEELWTAEYRDKLAHGRAATRALLLELDGLLTDAQREHLLARVDSLVEDLVLLARAADPADCVQLGRRARAPLSWGAAV